MSFGNAARIVTVVAACVAAAGSATSSSSAGSASASGPELAGPQGERSGAPPPQQMDPSHALGLWHSSFGAVKIEADLTHGGLPSGGVHGVWLYQRGGQDVVGYFSGTLRGNVLEFRWQEPGNPPLAGDGYLVFNAPARQYSGRWWSERRDRVGEWNGWRPQPDAATPQTRDPGQSGQPRVEPPPAQPSPYQRRQPYRPPPAPQPTLY